MESRDPQELSAAPLPAREERGLAGALIAGGLLGAALGALTAMVLAGVASLLGRREPFEAWRAFLRAGGWLWLPLWGGALAAWRVAAGSRGARRRVATALFGVGLALLPLAVRPRFEEPRTGDVPRTPPAKARAILKWSYASPEEVDGVIALSHDLDPDIREKAVLALGVNLIVTDIEHASPVRPARFLDHPLRGRLRARLLEAMRSDSVEAVRAEAARALWKAPLTFGAQTAAAETLAAVLDRASRPAANRRLTWLALDAAAGASDAGLKAAAARFANTTADTELARVAAGAAR